MEARPEDAKGPGLRTTHPGTWQGAVARRQAACALLHTEHRRLLTLWPRASRVLGICLTRMGNDSPCPFHKVAEKNLEEIQELQRATQIKGALAGEYGASLRPAQKSQDPQTPIPPLPLTDLLPAACEGNECHPTLSVCCKVVYWHPRGGALRLRAPHREVRPPRADTPGPGDGDISASHTAGSPSGAARLMPEAETLSPWRKQGPPWPSNVPNIHQHPQKSRPRPSVCNPLPSQDQGPSSPNAHPRHSTEP